jgi:hypothetical protein
MGPFDFLNHVLNFIDPALWLAVLLPLGARIFVKKRPTATLRAQAGANFVVSFLVLVLGLWFFGHDGKMTTYIGMTLVCATSQWIMLRGWRV